MSVSVPRLGFLLIDVNRKLRQQVDYRAREVSLTQAQWYVLAYLSVNEGIQQVGLADILGIKSITLARTVDKLQAKGLLERRPHPTDRRSWLLYLTQEACPTLAAMHEISKVLVAEAVAGVTEAEQKLFLDILERIKVNMQLAVEKP